MSPADFLSFYKEQESLVKGATQKAYDKWGCPELLDTTTFEWNKRFKNRAADACFTRLENSFNIGCKGVIRMSIDIWPHMGEQERYETAVHEAAHIAAPYLSVRKSDGTVCMSRRVPNFGHGIGWKQLMWKMGLEATRCHSVDTFALGIGKRRQTVRFTYQCGCDKGMWCSPKTHEKIQKGWVTFKCKKGRHLVDRGTPFTKGLKE